MHILAIILPLGDIVLMLARLQFGAEITSCKLCLGVLASFAETEKKSWKSRKAMSNQDTKRVKNEDVATSPIITNNSSPLPCPGSDTYELQNSFYIADQTINVL